MSKQILTSDQVKFICHYYCRDGRVGRYPDITFGSGVDALWIDIDEDHGIKTFSDGDMARSVYHYCRIFSTMNITPKVWDFNHIQVGGKDIYYFFMERVTILAKVDSEDVRIAKKQEARNAMESVSYFRAGDYHSGNFGIAKDGRALTVDIGYIEYNDGDKFLLPCYEENNDKR